MKKRITAMFFLISTLYGFAQSSLILTSEKNTYQANDDLIKQQVEYCDPGSRGKNLFWDFSNLRPVNFDYGIRYFIPDSTNLNQFCGMEHRTRYYYIQQQDTLWCTGYENPTTYMQYVQPELRLCYPFTYGDTLGCRFEGVGEYGRRLKLHVLGTTRVEADAEGQLKLPDSEILQKALRIHTVRHYTEIGRDSVEMLLDTYSWYVSGTRYPVFESIKNTVFEQLSDNGEKKDTVVFTTSFYYPPVEQRKQVQKEENFFYEEESEEIIEDINAVLTEVSLYPNPVVDKLIVNYYLTREADVLFTVYNMAGMLMVQDDFIGQSAGYHTVPIEMSQLAAGVYSVVVQVNDKHLIMNVVKK